MRKSQITPERKQRKKRFFNSICTPLEHPDSPQILYLWAFSQFSPLLKLGKSILLKSEGKSAPQIAEMLEVTVPTVYTWVKRYEENGIKGLET